MEEVSIGVIREAYGKVAYSHKTQEKAKGINEWLVCAVKWLNVILVTAVTLSATYNFYVSPQEANKLTAVLSAASLLFLIAQLSFNPEVRVQQHKRCADKLWLIREKYVNLISDMTSKAVDMQRAITTRDQITQELFKVYEDAPSAGGLAYWFARRALQLDEELTFSEKELSQLLPESLRKS